MTEQFSGKRAGAIARGPAVAFGAGTHGRTVARALGLIALGVGLSACSYGADASMEKTYLPDSTPRISAPAQRNAQLSTGTYHDDIPEYTGAPGIDANWPAYVPRTRKTAYRSIDVTTKPPAQ